MQPVSLDEGVRQILSTVKTIDPKPAVIGIYGHAHAGKTTLVNRLIQDAHGQGMIVAGGKADDASSYTSALGDPDLVVIEDMVLGPGPVRHQYSLQHIGKVIDQTVLIRNQGLPTFNDQLYGDTAAKDYDLIIDNPGSHIKP